jgi:hypothetical protein
MELMTIASKSAISLVIIVLSAYVAIKTGAMHRLTQHRGIKSFRDAFIFFVAAFAINIAVVVFAPSPAYQPLIVLFNYTLCMGGFLLVYSLVWKELGEDWQYVLHAAAIGIALADLYYFRYATFLSQLIVLSIGVVMSYTSYKDGKQPMRQLLFIAIVIALLGYVVNVAARLVTSIMPSAWIAAYLITAGAFALISYAVAKSLGGGHG